MKKSNQSLEQWLEVAVRGRRLNGEISVVRVAEGQVVEIWHDGCAHFGSGGCDSGAVFVGNQPIKVGVGQSTDNEFVREESAAFEFHAPCVVYEYSYNLLGNPVRYFRQNLYVCVSLEDMKAATIRVIDADAAEVKASLAYAEEVQLREKEEKQAYAKEQVEVLIKMGFPRPRAVAIMKAAGPGRAVLSAMWAIDAYQAIGSFDAIDIVLGNLGGSNGFGRARMEVALKALGFPPVGEHSSSGLFKVLMGAHVAIGNGLPPAVLSGK